MGKKVDASAVNAKLAKIATATHLAFCTTEPANYAAIAALKLLDFTITAASNGAADGTSGAYTFAVNGTNRRMTVAAQAAAVTAPVSSGANGTAGTSVNATYACLHDGATLLMGTTVPTFSVTAGQQYTSQAMPFDDSMVPV
jgi:hypothetical protein